MNDNLLSVDEIGVMGTYKIVPLTDYTMVIRIGDKVLGKVDWNVSPATFEGDMDGSARVFFDYVIGVWPVLLDQAVRKATQPAVPEGGQGWQGWQLREVYFDEDMIPVSYRAPQQPAQTVNVRWDEAPRSISFGAGMMITDIGLDKDSIATVTCHKDDLHKFERLLSAAQPAQEAT